MIIEYPCLLSYNGEQQSHQLSVGRVCIQQIKSLHIEKSVYINDF